MIRKTLFLVVVLILMETSLASAQYSTPRCFTVVHDFRNQLSPATISSNLEYIQGVGIQLAGSATSGVVTYSGQNTEFPVNTAVPSWNIDLPTGTGARIEVRATSGTSVTAWYEVARIGTTPLGNTRIKSDSHGKIDYDTLELSTTWSTLEYRTTLYTNTAGITPTLRLMSICADDSNTKITYTHISGTGVQTSLPVPWRSQYWTPDIGGVICGPTSLSMAEQYFGENLDTAIVAADAYDDYGKIYGNWPFLAEAAAKRGMTAYVMRCTDQRPIRDEIAAGHPVILSVSWETGDLTNAPIPSTPGHLILCVGITADGDFLINDPAGSNSTWNHVVYSQDQMAKCWLNDGGIAIPISAKVGKVTFSPDEGIYSVSQNVEVSCDTEDVVIHYTLDGSDPTESDPSIASGGTISLSASAVLKARAFRTNWTPSDITEANYEISSVVDITGGTLKAGVWNMVSIPADPQDPDPAKVFSGIDIANASLQYWQNNLPEGGFQAYGVSYGWTGPITRGIPYWLCDSSSVSDKSISYSGTVPAADFVMTIPAHTQAPYWIAIGTPFTKSVSADSIQFKNAAKRGDTWISWADAYSSGDSSKRIVDSNAQEWDASRNEFIRVTPSALSVLGDKIQMDPWCGYWLLVTDNNELDIRFVKPD